MSRLLCASWLSVWISLGLFGCGSSEDSSGGSTGGTSSSSGGASSGGANSSGGADSGVSTGGTGASGGEGGSASGGTSGSEGGSVSEGGTGGSPKACEGGDCGVGICCVSVVDNQSVAQCQSRKTDCQGLVLCETQADCQNKEVCCPQGFCGGCD